jgi:selenium metabolism protein YedF
MKKLDYRQFQCPYPVVETRKAMLAQPDEELQVLVNDQISADNIGRLAASLRYQLAKTVADIGFLLTLTPAENTEITPAVDMKFSGKSVIFCGTEQMGEGDVELGRILLKNFFITLTELDTPPDAILFVNAGVKLACQGSETLQALNVLACRGVDIASCGLCLDFYQLKEKLQVGRTTNMLEIAETTLQAQRVIRP